MPKLQLMQLTCTQTEDLTGPDEAYLKVNGTTIWGPSSTSNGQTHNLLPVVPITFLGAAVVELFDRDVGSLLFDPDDFLGAIAVTSASVNLGPQAGHFSEDGAAYLLVYQVTP